jgi:hypothetical protein
MRCYVCSRQLFSRLQNYHQAFNASGFWLSLGYAHDVDFLEIDTLTKQANYSPVSVTSFWDLVHCKFLAQDVVVARFSTWTEKQFEVREVTTRKVR